MHPATYKSNVVESIMVCGDEKEVTLRAVLVLAGYTSTRTRVHEHEHGRSLPQVTVYQLMPRHPRLCSAIHFFVFSFFRFFFLIT